VVGGEEERILQNMQGNLSRLTHRILMVQVEDILEAMQWQVVGVPRAWVRLFEHLSNIIFFYYDTHIAPHAYMSWILYYRLYIFIGGFNLNFVL
jgi:hypothetical protein